MEWEVGKMMKLSNDENIKQFMHCSLCITDGIPEGESPQTWARLSVGWTKEGFQVWCNRHNCNVIHVDFEGIKHPADLTRTMTKEELK